LPTLARILPLSFVYGVSGAFLAMLICSINAFNVVMDVLMFKYILCYLAMPDALRRFVPCLELISGLKRAQ
jgi:hypothetical protein